MKRAIALTLVLLLLLVPTVSAEEAATALRFGSTEPVNAIYACYTVTGDAETVTVTFDDGVKNYAYANFVGGKLWVSIASLNAIDLSKPVGWVTAKTADGQPASIQLTLELLQFDGQDAQSALVVADATASRTGQGIAVTVAASYGAGETYVLLAAAYDASGKMLSCRMQSAAVAANAAQSEFALTLPSSAEAATVKVFFVTPQWTPVSSAEITKIG